MIRWITPELGTAAYEQVADAPDIYRLDVRELVDKAGNRAATVRERIQEGLERKRQGHRIVVCCDYGISRSSAIATGILALDEGLPFGDATRRVLQATGEPPIRVEVLSVVREALMDLVTDRGRPNSQRCVLVTGGTGFIGTNLLPNLRNQLTLITPSRQEVDLTRTAVELDLFAADHRVDTIVHLANPRMYSTNAAIGPMVTMLKNVLDVCVARRAHLVFAGTWEVFSGYRTQRLDADETLPLRPGSTYGFAKAMCEMLIDGMSQRHGLDYTILRSGPVYGPGCSMPKFLWNFHNKAKRNMEIVTHRYRNGFPALDFLFVDDLCAAMANVVKKRPTGVLHVGTGKLISTRAIAEMIIEMTGSASALRIMDIDEDACNIALSTDRAEHLLEWQPTVSFERGLAATIEAAEPDTPA